MSSPSPQLQELAAQLEEIEKQRNALELEIDRMEETKEEIDEAIDAVAELESGSTVQVPVGGGAYVRATVEEIDEIIVELGADYAAERDREGATDTLEAKQETLDERIEELRSEIATLESKSQELEGRLEGMRAQQLQQLQGRGDE